MGKKIILSIVLVLLILLFLLGFWLGKFLKTNYFEPFSQINGQTNFLLLGVNGSNAADADLTDTIIFASVNWQKNQVSLISLPRDIWIKGLETKINAVYHYGGFPLIKKTVSEILGQRVDFVFVLNFSGFEKFINALGGVEVEVVNSFDDPLFPIPGKENDWCNGDREFKCRYELVHFEKGSQIMDGATALKYVRSRHAEGEEGTDFARAARQQQLLKGLKNTFLSQKIYLKPGELKELWQVVQNNLQTDFSGKSYGSGLWLLSGLRTGGIHSFILEDDLLIHPKTHYSKQWVLEPKGGNWDEVKKFVETKLQ